MNSKKRVDGGGTTAWANRVPLAHGNPMATSLLLQWYSAMSAFGRRSHTPAMSSPLWKKTKMPKHPREQPSLRSIRYKFV